MLDLKLPYREDLQHGTLQEPKTWTLPLSPRDLTGFKV